MLIGIIIFILLLFINFAFHSRCYFHFPLTEFHSFSSRCFSFFFFIIFYFFIYLFFPRSQRSTRVGPRIKRHSHGERL